MYSESRCAHTHRYAQLSEHTHTHNQCSMKCSIGLRVGHSARTTQHTPMHHKMLHCAADWPSLRTCTTTSACCNAGKAPHSLFSGGGVKTSAGGKRPAPLACFCPTRAARLCGRCLEKNVCGMRNTLCMPVEQVKLGGPCAFSPNVGCSQGGPLVGAAGPRTSGQVAVVWCAGVQNANVCSGQHVCSQRVCSRVMGALTIGEVANRGSSWGS